MKKLSLFLIAVLIITSPLFAQRSSDIEGGKDSPLFQRAEGAIIEYYKVIKWDTYKLPINLNEPYLNWEAPATLEGKIIRTQYSISADNNPAYLLKVYKSTLEKAGFEIFYAKTNKDMGISPQKFPSKYYKELGNLKSGYAFATTCSDQSFIMAKIRNDGQDIFVAIYISGFNNISIITQDVIEAESFQQEKIIATVVRGSRVIWDDKLGHRKFYVAIKDDSEDQIKIKEIEGDVHHRFCRPPSGLSSNEIVENYIEAIEKNGGKVLESSNSKESIKAFMKVGHPYHDLKNFEYAMFKDRVYKTFFGMVPTESADHYIMLAFGNVESKLYYSLVIVKTIPMQKGLVSVDNLADVITKTGHIAIYDILFDTGKSEIKGESADALKNIAEYLNANADKQYFVVGHTDNVGNFEANINLSTERAKAVVNALIIDTGVKAEQLIPYGVGPVAPVATNTTDKGKAKNRRVEIVEQ
ncbi:MAG: OmpA family protein [Bacteroidales bacterium]|nr:OmpA family protein [Bacteroidales bacterium]